MSATVFVLILMYFMPGKSAAITTAEFTSQERCEAAKVESAKLMDGGWGKTYAVCVPK